MKSFIQITEIVMSQNKAKFPPVATPPSKFLSFRRNERGRTKEVGRRGEREMERIIEREVGKWGERARIDYYHLRCFAFG